MTRADCCQYDDIERMPVESGREIPIRSPSSRLEERPPRKWDAAGSSPAVSTRIPSRLGGQLPGRGVPVRLLPSFPLPP